MTSVTRTGYPPQSPPHHPSRRSGTDWAAATKARCQPKLPHEPSQALVKETARLRNAGSKHNRYGYLSCLSSVLYLSLVLRMKSMQSFLLNLWAEKSGLRRYCLCLSCHTQHTFANKRPSSITEEAMGVGESRFIMTTLHSSWPLFSCCSQTLLSGYFLCIPCFWSKAIACPLIFGTKAVLLSDAVLVVGVQTAVLRCTDCKVDCSVLMRAREKTPSHQRSG
jgi:hypothetical protein